MKIIDKLKNMFTEEVEMEVPIKKEVRHVEIPAPITNVDVSNTPIEEKNKVIEKEEKFVFPVYFDDKDFEDIQTKPDRSKKEVYGNAKNPVKDEPKIFKPTPIISPVYGILNKNYHKDDITSKPKMVSNLQNSNTITIDEIRKKAYGTLEDELETTLFGRNSILFNDEIDTDETDIFDELEQDINDHPVDELVIDIMETEEQHDNTSDDIDLGLTDFNLNDKNDDEEIEELLDITSQPAKKTLSESDLFNLIDSMYEKGDE